jgi:curved DNA-binding protein CbpA
MEFKDYYATLGVSKSATEHEIKVAFRKLARRYHPDVNPGDKAAEARFMDINEAYAVLGDPERRKKYDELGATWPLYEQTQSAVDAGSRFDPFDPFGSFGFGSRTEDSYSDFFSTFFGDAGNTNRRPRGGPSNVRGRDVEHEIELTLEDASRGTIRRLPLTDDSHTRMVDVRIPAGVTDGSRVRVSGHGERGAGGAASGDLYLRIKLVPRSVSEPTRRGVRRTPHMDVYAPTPLRPGTSFTVTVYADQLPSRPNETAKDIEVEAAATLNRLELEVWIGGTPHFTFPGARVKPFVIDLADPASQPSADFDVQVAQGLIDGSGAQLVANFTYCGRPSGQVKVAVMIDAGRSRASSVSNSNTVLVAQRPALSVDVQAVTPDLTIEITDPENSRQRLQCRVWTRHLEAPEIGLPFDWLLNQQTEGLVQSYMAAFVKHGISSQSRLENLVGAGKQLWEATPKPVRDIFWKLVDAERLKTILIVSEEPYIPWELMVPHRRGETRQPIGAEFDVGRWLPSDFVSPAQQLVLSQSLVVAPDYPGPRPRPLAHAAREARLVLQVVDGEAVTPASESTFRLKAGASTANLLHFACHGAESSSLGVQAIYLEDSQLSSLQVAGMEALEKAFRTRPLVFLNACEIGRLTPALVGVGGFAKAFIDLGASAVIAPLWSVRDSVAHTVADEFYSALGTAGHVRPAEVFRRVRKRAYSEDPQTTGEDTYAAYCFYGDPSAVVVLEPKHVPHDRRIPEP